MSGILVEMRDTLDCVIEMHQLNYELLETLNLACKWLLENKVKMPRMETFVSLLNKADALMSEINSRPSRRKVTDFKTDEEVPAPGTLLLAYSVAEESTIIRKCAFEERSLWFLRKSYSPNPNPKK